MQKCILQTTDPRQQRRSTDATRYVRSHQTRAHAEASAWPSTTSVVALPRQDSPRLRHSACEAIFGKGSEHDATAGELPSSDGAPLVEIGGWRAHEGAVVSIQYVPGASDAAGNAPDGSEDFTSRATGLLLTSSADGNVSLWSRNGSHIGIFGVSPRRSLHVPTTWATPVIELPQLTAEKEVGSVKVGSVKHGFSNISETEKFVLAAAEAQRHEAALERQEHLLYQDTKAKLERRTARKGDILGSAASEMDSTTLETARQTARNQLSRYCPLSRSSGLRQLPRSGEFSSLLRFAVLLAHAYSCVPCARTPAFLLIVNPEYTNSWTVHPFRSKSFSCL